MSHLVNVMLCTNDPNNGRDTGRCCAVHIGGIELECCETESPRCHASGGALRLSRKKFKYRHHQDWVGNWCWQSVDMEPLEALRLVAYLRELKWHCVAAESHFFDLYRNDSHIGTSDLLNAID